MKKTLSILLTIVLLFSIAACGAKSFESSATSNFISDYAYNNSGDYAVSNAAEYEEFGYSGGEAYDVSASLIAPESASEGLTMLTASSSGSGSLAEKIIYSADAAIETTQYDEAITVLAELLNSYGGFIENSYENTPTRAEYGYSATYRSLHYASYTLRVPKEGFHKFLDALGDVGSVQSRSTSAENVTEQFADYESRLKAYRTEEERLLAMFSKADTIPDMITIESKLSEVRYSIESLTSSLLNLSNRVSFSTVRVSINEVREYTPVVTEDLTYRQQLSEGLKSTFKGIGQFFSNLFKYFVIALPVLLILVAVAIVLVILLRRSVKKRRAKREIQKDNDEVRKE